MVCIRHNGIQPIVAAFELDQNQNSLLHAAGSLRHSLRPAGRVGGQQRCSCHGAEVAEKVSSFHDELDSFISTFISIGKPDQASAYANKPRPQCHLLYFG